MDRRILIAEKQGAARAYRHAAQMIPPRLRPQWPLTAYEIMAKMCEREIHEQELKLNETQQTAES